MDPDANKPDPLVNITVSGSIGGEGLYIESSNEDWPSWDSPIKDGDMVQFDVSSHHDVVAKKVLFQNKKITQAAEEALVQQVGKDLQSWIDNALINGHLKEEGPISISGEFGPTEKAVVDNWKSQAAKDGSTISGNLNAITSAYSNLSEAASVAAESTYSYENLAKLEKAFLAGKNKYGEKKFVEKPEPITDSSSVWTTHGGVKIKIQDMDDNHLLNTIKMLAYQSPEGTEWKGTLKRRIAWFNVMVAEAQKRGLSI